MRFHNIKYRFSFLIPLGFEVLDRLDYPRYHIDEENTVEILINYQPRNTKSISINRDDTFKSVEEYEELINLNAKYMQETGMKVVFKETINLTNGRRIDRLYSTFKSMKCVTYFTNIRDMMIAASVEINKPQDQNEQNLLMLFSSIEEE